ncbi:uncharacterized protein [Sylvia atricapilla]|uniref:uncharacterized protein n=1 Tax=Sylvia atricapilla TaxID=48155 RepID=UPI003396EBB5
MGGAPTRLAQRQSPPSGKANAGAGRRISLSSLGLVPPPLRQQLRFARDWTELELRRRRSSAECVRPPRGGSCPQAVGSRAPAQFGAALAATNKERELHSAWGIPRWPSSAAKEPVERPWSCRGGPGAVRGLCRQRRRRAARPLRWERADREQNKKAAPVLPSGSLAWVQHGFRCCCLPHHSYLEFSPPPHFISVPCRFTW